MRSLLSGTEFIRSEVNKVVFWKVYSLGRHVGFSVGGSRQNIDIFAPLPDPYRFQSFHPTFCIEPMCRLREKLGWDLFSVLGKITGKKINKFGNNVSRVAPLCKSARPITYVYKVLIISYVYRHKWQKTKYHVQSLQVETSKAEQQCCESAYNTPKKTPCEKYCILRILIYNVSNYLYKVYISIKFVNRRGKCRNENTMSLLKNRSFSPRIFICIVYMGLAGGLASEL